MIMLSLKVTGCCQTMFRGGRDRVEGAEVITDNSAMSTKEAGEDLDTTAADDGFFSDEGDEESIEGHVEFL